MIRFTQLPNAEAGSCLRETQSAPQSHLQPNFQGTFRQYVYAPFKSAFTFPEGCDIDYDILSCTIANSLTICGFIDFCQKNKHSCVINDAASGACGKIFVKAAKKYGITLINLVRKDEQVKQLEDLGADVALNYQSEEFQGQSSQKAEEN